MRTLTGPREDGREGGLIDAGKDAAAAEAAVIARVRAGETEAYASLIRAHTKVALRVATALGAGSDAVDPELAVTAGERRSALVAALEQLSEDHRLVVTYRYLLEMDELETARTLGWARRTAKSRLEQRTAAPTLLWVHASGLTMRLEGVDSMARAVAIAETTEISP